MSEVHLAQYSTVQNRTEFHHLQLENASFLFTLLATELHLFLTILIQSKMQLGFDNLFSFATEQNTSLHILKYKHNNRTKSYYIIGQLVPR